MAIRELVNGLGGLPRDYVSLDLETTGFSPKKSRAIQFGLCVVKDCVPVKRINLLVKHEDLVSISPGAIKVHGITLDILNANGIDGKEIMCDISKMLCEGAKQCILGHNVLAFDIPFINAEFQRYGCDIPEVTDNNVFDTGMFVVALQLNEIPMVNESMFQFWVRMKKLSRKVHWSLDNYCKYTYGLDKMADLQESGTAHDATFDAFATHKLVEQLRREYERG